MQVLRTPDARLDALDGYSFAPHYSTVTADDGTALRLHYVDEGPGDAATVLLMNGEPRWSCAFGTFRYHDLIVLPTEGSHHVQ